MAYAHRKDPWKDELWNVSLLPIVQAPLNAPPPIGPAPGGGTALKAAAVLSVFEEAARLPLAQAA